MISSTQRKSTRLIACLLLLLAWCSSLQPAAAQEPYDRTLVQNALRFLRTQQLPDGSFAPPQAHLKTGLFVLALLSVDSAPAESDRVMIEKAIDYLLRTSPSSGDLSDPIFTVESHSIATTALICAHEHLRSPELRKDASERIQRALRQLQRWQDRSSSSPSRGGWKMEGDKGQSNDRRASAWALVCQLNAQRYGLEVTQSGIDRAMHFMLGSFKETADNPDQVGGFSVDTEGLAVELISAMGGWCLTRFGGEQADDQLEKNMAFLQRQPPVWTGPNYFYSAFFRTRALRLADVDPTLRVQVTQRLLIQLRDHQAADGSISIPPGNAQNTVVMGPVFSTAMAVLIAQANDSRLPFDEEYQLAPRF